MQGDVCVIIFYENWIAIPGNENILLVIGDDGFYQFNFDDPNQLVQLSHIPVRGK